MHSGDGDKVSVPESDVAAMAAEMKAEQEMRDSINPKASTADTSAMHAIHAFQCGEMDEANRLLATASSGVNAVLDEIEAGPRPWYTRGAPSVASCLEHFGTATCLAHFFTNGELAPRGTLPRLLDTEYLLAVMGFCQELSPFAIGRATAGDAGSVLLCSILVGSTFAKLQEFDFRNGPLRRKFDGVKYVLRKCEDLLYELSLSGKFNPPPAGGQDGDAAPPAKRARQDGTAAASAKDEYPRLSASEFDIMRVALESADAQREAVIKRTRDVQKLSKQAIYSLHRYYRPVQPVLCTTPACVANVGSRPVQTAAVRLVRCDKTKAEVQLTEARDKAQAIESELLTSHPELRAGSFSNAIEEYAEARLYQVWFSDSKSQTIAGPSHPHFAGMVETTEYLGGLADFTGEVGRWAVAAASRRDEEAVRAALATDHACLQAWMALQVGGKLGKKEGAIKTNTRKVESLLYDLSVARAGGKKASVASDDGGDGGGDGGEN